jgi:hypothetical protein
VLGGAVALVGDEDGEEEAGGGGDGLAVVPGVISVAMVSHPL